MIYAETSVLVSLVLHDSNSASALELAAAATRPFFFNRLLRLELCNAVRLNVAAGEIDEVGATEAGRQVEELLRGGKLAEIEPDWDRVLERSIGFSKAHTSSKRTRSFDILHVAAAVELGAGEFWSFDKRQRSLALEVGLKINS